MIQPDDEEHSCAAGGVRVNPEADRTFAPSPGALGRRRGPRRKIRRWVGLVLLTVVVLMVVFAVTWGAPAEVLWWRLLQFLVPGWPWW